MADLNDDESSMEAMEGGSRFHSELVLGMKELKNIFIAAVRNGNFELVILAG
ncbi:MAG: hypothetical protein O7D30_12305 [Rickettsia endosymbiont of Ixodes persulcatus]|nr:hypothetical protein [Rickettsia endosymbiont of Ixodes persulcatus]